MNTLVFLIMVVASLLYQPCKALPNGFTISQRYTLIGKKTVDINQIIASNTANWTTNPVLITITFPAYIQYYNSQYGCFSIADFEASNITSIDIKISIYSSSYTSCTLQLSTSVASQLQRLSISYFFQNLLDNYQPIDGLNYYFQIKCYTRSYDLGNNITSMTSIQKLQNIDYIDISSGLIIPPLLPIFINGLVATAINSSMSVALTARIVSNYTIIVRISSSSPSPTLIEYLSCTFCTYADNYTKRLERYYIFYSGVINAENTNEESYSNNHLLMNEINTFVGLTSFTVSNQNTFSFSTSTDEHSIFVSSNKAFDQLSITYFIVYNNYCSYKSPFADLISKQCYQTCPKYTSPFLYFYCSCNLYIKGKQACFTDPPKLTGTIIAICFGSASIIIHTIFIFYYFISKHKRRNNFQRDSNGNVAFEPPNQDQSMQQIATARQTAEEQANRNQIAQQSDAIIISQE